MKKHKYYWNYERCLKEALKYKTKTEFQKKSKGAYNSSRNNGWYYDVCSHMNIINTKPYGYWNIERCAEEALKYKTLNEFKFGSPSAYGSSMKHKFFKDICTHMIRIERLENGYWTKGRCEDESLKYKTRKEFQKNSPTAYRITHKNKWFDILSHMPNKYYNYTKEDCLKESLKYENRTDFQKNSSRIYSCSRKNDWLDEICSHMTLTGNRYKRCIYSVEFSDNYVYVGLTYKYNLRKWEHLNLKKSSVLKHIEKTGLIPIFKQLTDYIDVNDASKLEGIKLNEYVENGWIALNKNKCGAIGGSNISK